ncbi:MAG: hypothetical protein J1E38_07690 [Paramuribaculum sp.]|nr:hypothetical protein [Paramuribaculum sp.]
MVCLFIDHNHLKTENSWLQQNEEKYEVDKAIIQELNPRLSVTLSGYEKLIDHLGKEGTLELFNDEIEKIKIFKKTIKSQIFSIRRLDEPLYILYYNVEFNIIYYDIRIH